MEDWRNTIDGNLTATYLTLRSFLPGMIERSRGAIITMSSLAGRIPTPALAAYAAAKAGIVMLTRQVANEVAQYGIRANCVSPSTILTERIQGYLSAEQQKEWAAMHPLGRLGTPEDVALATLFLASECSSWLTGLTIDVAGGRVML
jgi:3-oxoacyl-[acyl-carrier protein] reductase